MRTRWVSIAVVVLAAGCGSDDDGAVIDDAAAAGPPANANFDYQIGGDYDVVEGTEIVTRDWFEGSALDGGYSICYVNAFQTQDDSPDVDRPDERSNWPAEVVLSGFPDDPNWGGEFMIDIGSDDTRRIAADHVDQMIETCATKGFDAVEYDNLDSWTRLDALPFDENDAIAFATIITERAHALGLAVGQKNTPELGAETSLNVIGFDFAVSEECGQFDECDLYIDVFGDAVVVIEYTDSGFEAACGVAGDRLSITRRDLDVTRPGAGDYVYDRC